MKRIPNLEQVLKYEDQTDSIIELDNFICELCEWGESIQELTEAQKQFYYNQNLEREVNTGGFEEYFANSTGDFAHETILSLKAIGANHTADILQSAIDQFPGKQVPKGSDARNELMQKLGEAATERWAALDESFFEYKDDLNSLNLEFVKKHRAEF
jgi:Domain of unknown function (DUF4375)